MAKKKYDVDFSKEDGVWRTIGGRRVFIRKGQSLSDAMKQSGKFKKSSDVSRNEYQISKSEVDYENQRAKSRETEQELLRKYNGEYDFSDNDYRKLRREVKKTREARTDMLHKKYSEKFGEYPGDTSKLKGKHINKENDISPMSEWSDTTGSGFSDLQDKEIAKRVKENKIVDSFGSNVVYQNDKGNWVTGRQNYNDYVTGKKDKLGGELALNEKEARDILASYDALEKYPYEGYVADMKSGNNVKYKEQKQANLDKMYKTIGYDDSKYNYGFEKKQETYEEYVQRNLNSDDYLQANRPNEYFRKMTNKSNDKDFHYAGEELYSDDPNRFGDKLRKINDKMNPTQTPYNSKAYAKELSQIYMAEEDYEDKITPKYIQDIDSARYGNMSDEEAIKTWIDGGADIVYVDDAREKLKNWGIPVRNDDPYGTYKEELTKQLLPIYKSDKQKVSLNKLPIGDLKEMAQDYKINTKGLSRQELIEKLLAIYNK